MHEDDREAPGLMRLQGGQLAGRALQEVAEQEAAIFAGPDRGALEPEREACRGLRFERHLAAGNRDLLRVGRRIEPQARLH